jgi:Zonular occludens toxin (Zot)
VAITLVTGPPGTGKTWYCVRQMLRAVEKGQFVATNIELRPGWQYVLAKRRRPWSKAAASRLADKYDKLLYTSTDLDELMSLRLPPCGKCKSCKKGEPCGKEGRGLVVLDEAHEWLNTRTLGQDRDGRARIVTWSSHHRKFGWNVQLVTQDDKRIDVQVRGNHEYHKKLKNLRKVPILGFHPFPNLFVAHTYWHGQARKRDRVGLEMYRLTKLANLYDTMASPVLHLGADEPGVIALPLTRERREERGTAPEIRPYIWQRRRVVAGATK